MTVAHWLSLIECAGNPALNISIEWALVCRAVRQASCVKNKLGRKKNRYEGDHHRRVFQLQELTLLLGEEIMHVNASSLNTYVIYGCFLRLGPSTTPKKLLWVICCPEAMKQKLSFPKWDSYLQLPNPMIVFYSHTHSPQGFLGLGWVPFGLGLGLSHSFTQIVTTKDTRFSNSSWQPSSFQKVWLQFIFSLSDTLAGSSLHEVSGGQMATL